MCKTRILFIVLVCYFNTTISAQQKDWDSTYRPGLYGFKVDLYKSYPHARTDIVFLGNSITDRVDWNELLCMNTVHNRGISGDITFGVLQRLDEVIDGHPAKVFILIGINDISRNIPDSVILLNHRRIIERIKKGSPETKIYLQTLMPVNNQFTQFKNHYNKDKHILAVNEGLKKLASQEGVELIDLYPHFLDKEGRLDAALTEDGLHVNAKGYSIWATLLKEGDYLK
jgi:lysophospholipase L1-like esterase